MHHRGLRRTTHDDLAEMCRGCVREQQPKSVVAFYVIRRMVFVVFVTLLPIEWKAIGLSSVLAVLALVSALVRPLDKPGDRDDKDEHDYN